jgi:hypothetical protein
MFIRDGVLPPNSDLGKIRTGNELIYSHCSLSAEGLNPPPPPPHDCESQL